MRNEEQPEVGAVHPEASHPDASKVTVPLSCASSWVPLEGVYLKYTLEKLSALVKSRTAQADPVLVVHVTDAILVVEIELPT